MRITTSPCTENSLLVKDKIDEIFYKTGFQDGYNDLEKLLDDIGLSARLNDFNSVQCQFNLRRPSEEDIASIVKHII